MLYQSRSYGLLPHAPGVYEFLNAQGEILYVGKAKDLKNRVSSYFANPNLLVGKTAILVPQVEKIRITIVESELESLLLEAALIKKHMPKYNIRLTDGKSYPLIRITKRMEFPAVLTARRPDDKKSEYFGPYPNATAMHRVLRILRRIFPYQSVLNHPKKICLYHHLGLCPCPPTFTTDEEKNQYKKTIRHIIGFLEGNSKKVVKELEKERDQCAKEEQFEKAAELQRQLDAIAQVTQVFVRPFEYETNPNLREDTREKEMQELQKILSEHHIQINMPHRIECYDNSNIQGTNPVASMVVATDGEMDKSQYRKFKIKTIKGANDFASMAEVLQRRMNHPEWPYPDLFVVDGGKGQVTSALAALNISNPPLIGLAKRLETIITPDLQEIHLPKSSPALKLIMRVRDEAHRFAITFHRKKRDKTTFV